jgi:hypothetical protein
MGTQASEKKKLLQLGRCHREKWGKLWENQTQRFNQHEKATSQREADFRIEHVD